MELNWMELGRKFRILSFCAHEKAVMCFNILTPKLLRYRSNWQIIQNRIISFIVLSSDNTNCKNDIQLFHQLFDELSVYRDYH